MYIIVLSIGIDLDTSVVAEISMATGRTLHRYIHNNVYYIVRNSESHILELKNE